jgi:transposase
MSDDYQRIELITGTARRRRRTLNRRFGSSRRARRRVNRFPRWRGGMGSRQTCLRWRRLMAEGGVAAAGSDEPVVGSSEVRRLEERVRDLMLEAVELRSAGGQDAVACPFTAKETLDFAAALGPALVKTFKRDYARVHCRIQLQCSGRSPSGAVITTRAISHSGLGMISPGEFIPAQASSRVSGQMGQHHEHPTVFATPPKGADKLLQLSRGGLERERHCQLIGRLFGMRSRRAPAILG